MSRVEMTNSMSVATADMHPAIRDVCRFFTPNPDLNDFQRGIADLYYQIAISLVGDDGGLDGPQLTVALQLLLQSRDAAIRASL